MLWVSTASVVLLAARVVIAATPRPPVSPSVLYPVRRVPATLSPPFDPVAPDLRSPPRARTACAAACRPAPQISPARPAPPWRRAGRSLSTTQPIPLHLFPAPAAVSARCSPLRRRRPRSPAQRQSEPAPIRPSMPASPAARSPGRRHPRLAEARHHALHDSLVRKRPRRVPDGFLDVGILNLAQRAIKTRHDLRDRANVAQRQDAGRDVAQLFNGRPLLGSGGGRLERRDRPARFHVCRKPASPEHAALHWRRRGGGGRRRGGNNRRRLRQRRMGGGGGGGGGAGAGSAMERAADRRWLARLPSRTPMRPSTASSGATFPTATPNRPSQCSGVTPGLT